MGAVTVTAITIAEAAEYTGLTPSGIYERTEPGQLPSAMLNGRLVAREDEVSRTRTRACREVTPPPSPEDELNDRP